MAIEYIKAAKNEEFSVGQGQTYKVIQQMSQLPIEVQIGESYFLQSLF